MKKEDGLKALSAAVIAGILSGLAYYFVQLYMNAGKGNTIQFLSGQLIVSFGVLTVVRLFMRYPVQYRGKKGLILLVFCTVLNPLLAQFLEVTAVTYAGTAQMAIFMSLVPLMAVLLSVVINRELPTHRQLLFLLLTVVGVMIVKLKGAESGEEGSLLGFLLALATCVVFGLYRTMVRRLTADFSAFEIVYLSSAVGAVCFTAIAMLQTKSIAACFGYLQDLSCVAAVIYNGGVIFAMVFLMMTYAAGKMPVAIAQSINLLNMPVTILVGVFLLKEAFSLADGIGSVLVLAGVLGSSLCYDTKNVKQNISGSDRTA